MPPPSVPLEKRGFRTIGWFDPGGWQPRAAA